MPKNSEVSQKMCEYGCGKPAEMWTYRLEDTGKRYMKNGVIEKVERPDGFVALCGMCASQRINSERGIDWKEILQRGW